MIKCQNNGCGQLFEPHEAANPASSLDSPCRFHPGEPYFANFVKGWACCVDKQQAKDFDGFLKLPGCTQGAHSSVKKAPEKAPQPAPIEKPAVKQNTNLANQENVKKNEILSDFKQLEVKSIEKIRLERESFIEELKINYSKAKKILRCSHNACKQDFETNPKCIYHPGNQMFHDGLKFWTCCKIKTTDFNAFQNQPGCVEGEHDVKSEAEISRMRAKDLQIDELTSNSQIELTIYNKFIDFSSIRVHSNGEIVKIHFVYFDEKGNDFQFTSEKKLTKIANIDQSFVNAGRMKIEVKMRL